MGNKSKQLPGRTAFKETQRQGTLPKGKIAGFSYEQFNKHQTYTTQMTTYTHELGSNLRQLPKEGFYGVVHLLVNIILDRIRYPTDCLSGYGLVTCDSRVSYVEAFTFDISRSHRPGRADAARGVKHEVSINTID